MLPSVGVLTLDGTKLFIHWMQLMEEKRWKGGISEQQQLSLPRDATTLQSFENINTSLGRICLEIEGPRVEAGKSVDRNRFFFRFNRKSPITFPPKMQPKLKPTRFNQKRNIESTSHFLHLECENGMSGPKLCPIKWLAGIQTTRPQSYEPFPSLYLQTWEYKFIFKVTCSH